MVSGDRELTFTKIAYANFLLRANPETLFVCTNRDANYPSTKRVFPGSGCTVVALATAVEREPVNVGKPEPFLYELMLEEMHLDPKRTLFVGDRLNTDVLFGHAAGFDTALVLTGVTSREQVEHADNSIRPDFVIESIQELLRD